jgi:ubiquinone/menaquinone biosynthesis C-methylase UbiE
MRLDFGSRVPVSVTHFRDPRAPRRVNARENEKIPRTVTWVDGRAATFPAVHGTPTDSFLDTVFSVTSRESVVADAACGAGTFTLMLAPRVKRVIAADEDEDLLRVAVGRGKERKLGNVEFYQSDLESESWTAWTPEGGVDAVTMHLYASRTAFREAARVLKPRASLVVSAFGPDQWQETGQASPRAFTPDALRGELEAAGFTVVKLVNDVVFVNAPNFQVMRSVFFQGGAYPIVDKWKADGRWEGLQESFRAGTHGLTESRLIAHAVKPG